MGKEAKKQRFPCGAVKHAGVANGGSGKRASANVDQLLRHVDDQDISAIFASIKKQGRSPKTDGGNSEGAKKSTTPSKVSERSTGDGLYSAPEKTVELSDAEFFNLGERRRKVPLKEGARRCRTSDGAALEDLLRREGVDRIISVEELQRITSANPKAGTTPNCPFDCDCCF
ncbi:putative Eukaryotic protein of unknown function (DUF1764) [Trypanosoma vivax]|uniref:Uncharacterized protein n=1 Tax=Trypanosoma vivax (strain Y486) TaxID=1055687 RepID=G0U3J3_TRYVY|nr:hypothetical protein TRVL_00365 [Trypanosoma vivax]KAH8613988.1 putative Eukaryotic protein of unknown function (DUF1764) [Trypanosoma vivax]CCC50850.1 conserved hypothetical protein [Trypanosoma vivax Y486]